MKHSVNYDPLPSRLEVPVAGGMLNVARAGAPPTAAEHIAVAVHGVTGSLMCWRTIARELDERICLLAPDLRGRGQSRKLPLALRIAAEHPERVAGVVLLDAGLPFSVPDAPEEFDGAISAAALRLTITFPSVHQYVQAWRSHPAFKKGWCEDLEAYARYDMVEFGSVVRFTALAAAVRADSPEMTSDGVTRNALDRVRAPVHLLRAERGLMEDEPPPGDPVRRRGGPRRSRASVSPTQVYVRADFDELVRVAVQELRKRVPPSSKEPRREDLVEHIPSDRVAGDPPPDDPDRGRGGPRRSRASVSSTHTATVVTLVHSRDGHWTMFNSSREGAGEG